MVYCGKPSKGCQSCREKKTRCDRATPSCGQCVRARRQCPGYRSELDLMFRNESEAVIVKAKSHMRPKPKSKPLHVVPFERPQGLSDTTLLDDASGSSLTPLNNQYSYLSTKLIGPTIQERSLGFFQANSPSWLRNYDLVDTLCTQTQTDDHLLACMSAVGLATFSNSVHAPELMAQARKDYVSALQLTNAALRSPTEVKKDTTLFSVMILSIFEALTGNNERSLVAWTEHINGAAALVNLRGREQLKTEAGRRMFFQVTSNLMISCIQRTAPMPAHMIELRKEIRHFIEPDNPAWILSGIIIDFTIFRSDIKESRIVGPRNILQKGLEIDRRFIAAFKNPPKEWKYDIIYTDENPDLIWNSNYHVYTDHWVAHMWNGMRTCRILLHETIRDQLLSASTALTPIFTEEQISSQTEASTNIVIQMRGDILASIPQHFPSATDGKPSMLLQGARSYFVLWPLYLVGAMDVTTKPIRNWVIGRLADIGEEAGIRQASVLAEYLKQKKTIEIWETKPTPTLPQSFRIVEKFIEDVV